MPTKAVGLALMACGGGEARLTAYMGVTKNSDGPAVIEIIGGGVRLRAKAIDGTFPDWRRVVPTETGTTAVVSTALLRRALMAARTSSAERGRPVKFAQHGSAIDISSKSPDSGDVSIRVEAETSGPVPEFGVNHQYLDVIADSFQRIGSKTVRLQITGSGNPIQIMPDEAISGTINILMPMRI